jgi:hypothetical protein
MREQPVRIRNGVTMTGREGGERVDQGRMIKNVALRGDQPSRWLGDPVNRFSKKLREGVSTRREDANILEPVQHPPYLVTEPPVDITLHGSRMTAVRRSAAVELVKTDDAEIGEADEHIPIGLRQLQVETGETRTWYQRQRIYVSMADTAPWWTQGHATVHGPKLLA